VGQCHSPGEVSITLVGQCHSPGEVSITLVGQCHSSHGVCCSLLVCVVMFFDGSRACFVLILVQLCAAVSAGPFYILTRIYF
jgi:hypothetical protein